MAAESGRLPAGQGQGKRGKGSQMKSPEKKKRKSNAQGAAFSHLSEFAPSHPHGGPPGGLQPV
ncbi:hypothetical protein COCON_G00129790 [Conger conger]|uniref:Uncharacterized protein n=1 Tax=Conger conger TaxID=82655 RepID=A0A9Q1HX56_CONCO|nr:hypothetical protein COCON_G00129790 [Conger conger]